MSHEKENTMPPQCKHKFIFLRQETRNIGYARNPTWETKDVYFCEKCLTYKSVKVDAEYKESSEWSRIQNERRW